MNVNLNQALSQHDLVARAQAGERLALELLVTAVRRAVHGYCRSRLATYSGGREVAEDVTQEVCLAVVDVLPRYRATGAPFAALVYAIAGNKIADAQRRYARTPVDLVDDLPEVSSGTAEPEHLALVRSDVDVLLALLDKLPERTGRVIRMRSEGMSAEEVGRVLGMSANAVRVMQHRGLARLRVMVGACPDASERFADRLERRRPVLAAAA